MRLFCVVVVVEFGKFFISVDKKGLSALGVVEMEVPLHMDFTDKYSTLCNLEDPFIQNTRLNLQLYTF